MITVPASEAHNLFHGLWTKAVGTEGYVKEDWMKLWGILVRSGLLEPTKVYDYRDIKTKNQGSA